VLFSALTVSLAMATMTMFPMYFLKSLGYAGVAVVAMAAVASVVITPAAIVFLGRRLDSPRLRRTPRAVTAGFWYRWTKAVLRRPVGTAAMVIAILVVLGAPFLGVKWGYPDDRVLPDTASSRQVGDEMRAGFGLNSLTDLTVVIPDVTGLPRVDLSAYA